MTWHPELSRRALLASLAASAIAPSFSHAGDVTTVAITPPGTPVGPQALVAAINSLGSTLTRELSKVVKGKNAVVAPHSLHVAFSLLALGANEATQKALLDEGLLKGGTLDDLLREHKTLGETLTKAQSEAVTLTTANSVWVPSDAKIKEGYEKRAKETFAAETQAIDFKAPEAAGKINAWASDKTKGLIPKIVDQLGADTGFVLANALYFKGQWAAQFDPANTRQQDFKLRNGEKKPVPMMQGEIPGGYWQDNKIRAIRLAYGDAAPGNAFALVIAMDQNEKNALNFSTLDLATKVSEAQFNPTKMKLSLPKFKSGFEGELDKVLATIGLKALKARASVYDQITGEKVTSPEVFHSAKIEMDEVGSTAAAATAITGTRSAELPVSFSLDRPFAFAIIHVPTGLHLMQGFIENPTI